MPGILCARVDLALGRTEAAAASAETALRTARAQGFPLHCSLALSVLGTVALRRGDLRAAAGHLRTLPCGSSDPDPRMAGLDGFFAARLERI